MAIENSDRIHAGFHVHELGPQVCSLVAAKGIDLATFVRLSDGIFEFDLLEAMVPGEYMILTGTENQADGNMNNTIGVRPEPNDPGPPINVSDRHFRVSCQRAQDGANVDIGFSVAFIRISQGVAFPPVVFAPPPPP